MGVTTRQEISQKLDWADSGIVGDNFFIARWAENSRGVAWAAVGYYAANGGYNEVWKVRNAVIDFDERAIVTV